eukprot:TRINITY_DN969_c0_g1_i8.p2 TRINITY_DN969_c0_g1~~TRINITY_DN969_c0_g1_i8.p2  ORF type:complete len:179 (-),score=6.34 TRINITY_DN969_c0_g1_i8:703-1239(-)
MCSNNIISINGKINIIMKAKKSEEELALNCASFAANISNIGIYEFKSSVELSWPSRQKIKLVADFINKGAEIEAVNIHGKLDYEFIHLQTIGMNLTFLDALDSIQADNLSITLDLSIFSFCSQFFLLIDIHDVYIGSIGARQIRLALQKNCILTELDLSMFSAWYQLLIGSNKIGYEE